MSERKLSNWINRYVEFASVSEAPRIFHFWAGVSAVAGALRRHVWFDQTVFKWFPNFYIIFVAPPGIATKSTTMGTAINLLREVPGIKFGPDEITWQALVMSFAAANESFPVGDAWLPQSAITIPSSEFGLYMDFRDSKLVNLHITLWDGLARFDKVTKGNGEDTVEAPWLNLIACTTPSWIADNMSTNIIGGGFTSRCVFVFGDQKERPIAYIKRNASFDWAETKADLIHDLEWIATKVVGEYLLTPEAEAWGTDWYERLWSDTYDTNNEDWVNNYLARKQAHMHKLAMVIAASQRDETVIEAEDLRLAELMLSNTEGSMRRVFDKVGHSDEARQAAKIKEIIQRKGEISYPDLYKLAQIYFPDCRNFEGIIQLFFKSGEIRIVSLEGGVAGVRWVGEALGA